MCTEEHTLLHNVQITEVLLKRNADELLDPYLNLGGLERCIEIYKTGKNPLLLRGVAEIMYKYASSPEPRDRLFKLGNQPLFKALVS